MAVLSSWRWNRRLNDLLIIQQACYPAAIGENTKDQMAEKEPDRSDAKADSIRAQIVAAAKKRFTHYGYGKTTMAEVAADCDMSPGNLYRFFPGKLDIAEAIATADFERVLVGQRQIARQPGKSARERLSDFLFDELRRTYTRLEKDPRVFEMARVIAAERPTFGNWMLENQRRILVEILEDGEKRGEFAVADKLFAAEMIQSATMKFHYPQLFSKLTLPKLERELEGVLNLLIHGLAAKTAAPA
jgi:AcrR family transcriptional regulator